MKNTGKLFIASGILLLNLFANTNCIIAQIIHTESFDSLTFPPTGWVITGGANSQWVRRTTGTNPVCVTHSGAAMARFSAFMQPNGSQELMTTPVIDYSGASGSIPTFSLWVYRDNSSTAGDSVSILVNTTNSLTGAIRIGGVARSRFFVLPVNELANGWYNYTFNIPASFNTNTNYILLNGTAHGGGHVYIDDVEWTEYSVACSAPIAGGVAATDSLICNGGGSTNLSLTGSNLTGGGLSFQWQSGTSATGPWTDFGTSTPTVNTGIINAATWFRAFVTCNNGPATDTSSALMVQVNPNPSPVITVTPDTVVSYCTGAAPLTFTASGALTYTWNPNIAINSIGDSAIVTPTGTSTYTVMGADSLGCTGSQSILVNVGTTPNVIAFSSVDTICSGQSVNLNANVPGGGFGIQFQWQPGNLNGPTQFVSPVVPTTYVVSATSIATGCVGYDSLEIYVYTTPVAGFTFSVNNLTYTFTNTSTSGVTYFWDFGDGNTDTSQNPVHTYGLTGMYTVTLTVTNGICTDTFTQILNVLSVSNQLSNGSEVTLAPNPASGISTITFSCDEPSVQLTILNSLGQKVIEKMVSPSSGTLYKSEIDLTSLAEGAYVLQVKTQSESVFMQLIKK